MEVYTIYGTVAGFGAYIRTEPSQSFSLRYRIQHLTIVILSLDFPSIVWYVFVLPTKGGHRNMYILDELYAGNVNPSEHAFQKDDPYAKAMDRLVEAEEQLSRKLDDTGKEQLKRLQECQAEVNSADAFYTFQTGFQLGVRLMLDALSLE